MNKSHSFRNRFNNFATYFGGLRECSSAMEAGRKPSREALMAIGLEPDMFDNVKFR